jgi:oxygen-dependent protoporphyrinogen oxidase
MAEARPAKAVVIGGGIAGLSAANRLRELAIERRLPLAIELYESGERLGGALETVRRGEFVIETGADSILAEKPAALKLAERIGLGAEITGTDQRYRKTFVVRNGRLLEIPEGFSLLAPSRMGPVMRSPLFSPLGKLRIALEPWIPRRRGGGDESLAAFVRRRLGDETLTRVAQALAGGIYTADPELLSIAATLPRFVEMERKYGSVTRGLRAAARARDMAARGESGARWSLFVSFRAGVGRLVEALAARLADSIQMGRGVASILPDGAGPDRSRRLRLRFADGGETVADAVVIAAPAYAAARATGEAFPALSAKLALIDYASAAVVNLAYHADDFPHAPAGFGFVAPAIERRKIIAGSFTSLKYPGRAPAGMLLVRAFIGGALNRELMALTDAEMVAAARDEFRDLLGVTAEPTLTLVRRWPNSMPQYAVGHLDRVAEIEKLTGQIPGLELAGAYLRGVGIPDCVASGERAAEAIAAFLVRNVLAGAASDASP